jgi:SAM-dependent methyltransferase
MTDSLVRKWNLRYEDTDPVSARPCTVLEDYAHLLPTRGRALDLACGLGGNAVFLTRRGLDTVAWDRSPVAIAKLGDYAKTQGLSMHAEVRDVQSAPPQPDAFDVIVVSYFLERELASALVRALRPDGLLFYQTWTREAVDDRGPGNPAFRLAPNELLTLFGDLRVIAYREEGLVGDTTQGLRNEACLVATRRQCGAESL